MDQQLRQSIDHQTEMYLQARRIECRQIALEAALKRNNDKLLAEAQDIYNWLIDVL